MRYLILLVLGIVIAVLSYQNKQHHTKLNPLSSRFLHPFDDRIRYRIADVDPRFGLTQEQVNKLTEEAIQIWTLGTGKQHFVYDDHARLTVHLVYDERQYQTEQRKKHIAKIEQEQKIWSQKKSQVDQVSQNLEQSKLILDAKKTQLDALINQYNEYIGQLNRLGGANPQLHQQLELQAQFLDQQVQQIQIEIEQYNFNILRLNAQVDELNQLNHVIDTSVKQFKHNFQPRLFDKGMFNGKSIYIYEFESIDDLRVTLAHEFGHALGLKHHDTPEALMYPMLENQQLENFRLHPADLALLANRP